MNIQLQRNKLIEQIQAINDVDLLKTIESLLDYGTKKELVNDVPEWHKDIVRNRIKNSNPDTLLSWGEMEKRLNKKHGH